MSPRNGQLGVYDRQENRKLLNCDELTRISLAQRPDNRKYMLTPTPVKAYEKDILRTLHDDAEEEEDDAELEEEAQTPVIGDLNHVFSVSCGELHSAAIVKQIYESDGIVYTWGCGGGGRLGNHGSYNPDYNDKFEAHIVHTREYDEDSYEYHLVPFLAQEVSCGGQHTCSITSSGELYSWGSNRYGQLGRAVSDESEGARDCFPMLVEMPPGTLVTSIACGDLHCICIAEITSQNRSGLFSWGCSDNGRLGYAAEGNQLTPHLIEFDTHEDFAMVSCGSSHSAALSSNGHLYTWGSNESGQCGPFKLPTVQELKSCERSPLPPDIWKPTLVKLEDEVKAEKPRQDFTSISAMQRDSRSLAEKSAMELSQRNEELFGGEKSVRSAGTSRRKQESYISDHKKNQHLQVACGENHTLVLINSKLWMLGSGLDRRRRLDNMELERIGKKKQMVTLNTVFLPRKLQFAFTDTAEVSVRVAQGEEEEFGESTLLIDKVSLCRSDGPTDPGDAVRYTKTVVEKYNPDDPSAPPEIEEHHCLTFTYVGDLEIKPGSILGFAGPCAPQGLQVESATEGPWFTVLGQASRSHGDQQQSSDDWHKWMGPNSKPFYVYKVQLRTLKGSFAEYDRLYRNGKTTNMFFWKIPDELNIEVDKGTPIVFILGSTMQDDELRAGDKLSGKKSGAEATVLTGMELQVDPKKNPIVRWFHSKDDYHTHHKFTVEVNDDNLNVRHPTFSHFTSWMNEHVKTENSKNMLVCLRKSIPQIISISSRGFHACALTDDDQVLVWGKGVSGRLGLGNEIDQCVPIILEFDGGSVPVKELGLTDAGVVVESVYFEVPDGLKAGDVIKEVCYRKIGADYSIPMVKELFNGPIDSVCRVVIERMVMDEDDIMAEEEQLRELVKYVTRTDWKQILAENVE
eukprot:758617-Hanusia_phi.AAC.2